MWGPIPGFWIDRKAPEITGVTPDPALPLALGEIVSAVPTCSDAGSGVATCDPDPVLIDTSQAGPVTVTLTATDNVGNQRSTTVTYNVAYAICLEYDPLKETSPGSVVPIKLFLCDADGTNLSSRQIDLTAVGIDVYVPGVDPPDNDAGQSNSPFEFRFRTDGYIYNFDSDGIPSGFHEFLFIVDHDDSVIYRAGFTIR